MSLSAVPNLLLYRLSQYLLDALHGKASFEQRDPTQYMLKLASQYANFDSCPRPLVTRTRERPIVVVSKKVSHLALVQLLT